MGNLNHRGASAVVLSKEGARRAARGVSLLALALLVGCGGGGEPSEAQRMEQRLDRTAVHVHVTLRARVERDAEAARQLARAASSAPTAARLAQTAFEAREEGAERLREGRRAQRPLAPRLVEGSELDLATDRAAYFLALVDEAVEDDTRIPKYVLIYEASRLDLSEVDAPALRRLARAAAALSFARAGYCQRVTEEVRAVRTGGETSRASVAEAIQRWLPDAELDVGQLHRDINRAVRVLAGGAEACCGIRRGNEARAARSIEAWIDEAEALGVAPARVAILRGWVALAQGDQDGAREQLAQVRDNELPAEDVPRYAMIRDALASSESQALRDATERLVDRRWVSSLVLSGAHQAFVEDGVMAALEDQPEATALRRLARGEAAVIEAARQRYPMFDQTHSGDQGAFDRIAELFR